jgi:hypothetical protein
VVSFQAGRELDTTCSEEKRTTPYFVIYTRCGSGSSRRSRLRDAAVIAQLMQAGVSLVTRGRGYEPAPLFNCLKERAVCLHYDVNPNIKLVEQYNSSDGICLSLFFIFFAHRS